MAEQVAKDGELALVVCNLPLILTRFIQRFVSLQPNYPSPVNLSTGLAYRS